MVTDLGADGNRYIKFWIDSLPESHREEPDLQQMSEGQSITDPSYHRSASPLTDTPACGDHSTPPEESYQPRPSRAGQIPAFGGLRQHVPGVPVSSPVVGLTGSPPSPPSISLRPSANRMFAVGHGATERMVLSRC